MDPKAAVKFFTQRYWQRNSDFIQTHILSDVDSTIDIDSTDSNEYAALNAFSWVLEPADYLLALDTSDSASSFVEDVMRDTNFYNPSGIKLMADAYNIADDFISSSVHLKGILDKERWTVADKINLVQLNRAKVQLLKGVEFTRSGKYSEAIDILSKSIDVTPMADALVARGAAYANIGALTIAADDFRAALQLDPSHANAQSYLTTTTEKMRSMNMPATMLTVVSSSERISIYEREPTVSVTDGEAGIARAVTLDSSISRLKEVLSSSSSSDESDNEHSSHSRGKKRKRDSKKKHNKDNKKSKKHKHSSSSKKEKKDKKSSHRKEKYGSSRKKSGTPIKDLSSSSDGSPLHPILQREPQKLWG